MGKLLSMDVPAPTCEGAEPRHVVFRPSGAVAYVVDELDSTITAYRLGHGHGNLAPFQVVSVLPDPFVGHSRAAAIMVSKDGRFVYASNRGHDSIAIVSVDRASGRLTSIGWEKSHGGTPRFLSLGPSGALDVQCQRGQ
jgi:6-phosphogluconolactonase (cycloisomerase 2 family)